MSHKSPLPKLWHIKTEKKMNTVVKAISKNKELPQVHKNVYNQIHYQNRKKNIN